MGLPRPLCQTLGGFSPHRNAETLRAGWCLSRAAAAAVAGESWRATKEGGGGGDSLSCDGEIVSPLVGHKNTVS